MLMRNWFIVYLMFTTIAGHQNFKRKRIHHPYKLNLSTAPRLPNIYRSLRAKVQNKMTGLALLSLNPNWVTLRPQKVKRRLTRTNKLMVKTVQHVVPFSRRRQEKTSMQSISSNAFIELDTGTPFIPKKIVHGDFKSGINSKKPTNYKNDAYVNNSLENPKNLNITDFHTNSESVNIDSKVLTKIQQLEYELKLMEVQVKHGRDTIEHLKTKVLEKDNEITGLNSLPDRLHDDNYKKKVNTTLNEVSNLKPEIIEATDAVKLYVPDRRLFKNSKTFTVTYSQTIPQSGYIKYDTGKKETNIVQNIETMKQDRNTSTNRSENFIESTHAFSSNTLNEDTVEALNTDNAQDKDHFVETQTKTVPNERSLKLDPDKDQLNPSDDRWTGNRRQFENYDKENIAEMGFVEDPFNKGQLVPYNKIEKDELENPDNEVYSNKNYLNMKPEDYQRKLDEERINDAIDWKKFNPEAFLAQISAEIKDRNKMAPINPKMLTMMPFSGRRMMSDKKINLTNIDSPLAVDVAELKIPEAKTTVNLLAPLPPKYRELRLATGLPMLLPPEPVGYDELNANDVTKPGPEFFSELGSRTGGVTSEYFNHQNTMRPLAPQAGKQKLILDSTEELIKNVLGRLRLGRSHVPLEFDAYRRKLHMDDENRRKILHEQVAKRMSSKISGRRNMGNMDPMKTVYGEYLSEEILRDPFLNDSLI